MTPDLLISCAREYLGTPWRHQGRLRGVGVDCVGLLTCAARDAGLELDDVPGNYSTVPQQGSMLAELEARLARVDPADIQPGDVLVFSWSLHPWHAALVTDVCKIDVTRLRHEARVWVRGIHIAHAYRRAGKCIEQPLNARWLAAVRSVWRWPGFCPVVD